MMNRELVGAIGQVCAAVEAGQNFQGYLTDLVTLILETAKIEAHEASEDRLQSHLIASHGDE